MVNLIILLIALFFGWRVGLIVARNVFPMGFVYALRPNGPLDMAETLETGKTLLAFFLAGAATTYVVNAVLKFLLGI